MRSLQQHGCQHQITNEMVEEKQTDTRVKRAIVKANQIAAAVHRHEDGASRRACPKQNGVLTEFSTGQLARTSGRLTQFFSICSRLRSSRFTLVNPSTYIYTVCIYLSPAEAL